MAMCQVCDNGPICRQCNTGYYINIASGTFLAIKAIYLVYYAALFPIVTLVLTGQCAPSAIPIST